jgi:hypothetical protein
LKIKFESLVGESSGQEFSNYRRAVSVSVQVADTCEFDEALPKREYASAKVLTKQIVLHLGQMPYD